METLIYFQNEAWEQWVIWEWEDHEQNIVFQKPVEHEDWFLHFLNTCWVEQRKNQISYILNWDYE